MQTMSGAVALMWQAAGAYMNAITANVGTGVLKGGGGRTSNAYYTGPYPSSSYVSNGTTPEIIFDNTIVARTGTTNHGKQKGVKYIVKVL